MSGASIFNRPARTRPRPRFLKAVVAERALRVCRQRTEKSKIEDEDEFEDEDDFGCGYAKL